MFKKNTCSASELIKVKSLNRAVVRDANVIETRDSWVKNYKEFKICPRKTGFLLIDTWDLEEEKNHVMKNARQKIMVETILPTIENHRLKGGLVIHSLNGGGVS